MPGARRLRSGAAWTWIGCALVVLSWLAATGEALGAGRTALVIGNGAYASAPLANAVNDASDMAAALERAGFEVLLVRDGDQRAMDEAVEQFAERLAQNRGTGLFYYSGHGVQVAEENYLLPTGGDIRHERDVKYGALNAGRVIDAMAQSGTALNIVVLDACRNNPLESSARSASRGLSRVNTAAAGLFVSFSTAPGEVALDGDGRNSPYTKHLLAALDVPGLTLEQVFKEALKGVHQDTGGAQVPWISSSFYGEFVFNGEGGASGDSIEVAARESADEPAAVSEQATREQVGLAPAPPPVPAAAVASRPLDGVYKVKGRNPDGTSYSGMARIARQSPDGRFELDWWIGPQRFSGTGRRDGRWIRVDWGSTSPVIYTQQADGALDGVWADGSASEVLEPVALAAKGGIDPAGTYDVDGRNAGGSGYRGTAVIARDGAGWRMRWAIGSSVYEGSGRLDGAVFTVDWGQPSPVIYAVGDDGRLNGLWAAGRGSETLTRRR